MDAGDWISGAVAAGAAILAWWVARQQAGIQERLTRVEETRRTDEVAARGRAQVTAEFRRQGRAGGGHDRHLVVRNSGPAFAHKVEVAVDTSPGVPGVIGLDVFPMDLQPGQEVPLIVTVGLRDTRSLSVEVRWIDGAGAHKEPWTLQVY